MVIIQNESGDSIGGLFAGTSESAFGSRSSSMLVKFTYGLGAAFMVLVFMLALFVYKSPSTDIVIDTARDSIKGEGRDWIEKPADTMELPVPSGETTAPNP
jgi:preprotein translocase subunit SecG